MKRLVQGVLALMLVFALSGCALFQSPNSAFVTAMDAGLNAGPANAAILDKYDKYIDADTTLTADTKKIEHQTTTMLRKTIADAKK